MRPDDDVYILYPSIPRRLAKVVEVDDERRRALVRWYSAEKRHGQTRYVIHHGRKHEQWLPFERLERIQ